jgi:hypothetical protein
MQANHPVTNAAHTAEEPKMEHNIQLKDDEVLKLLGREKISDHRQGFCGRRGK